MRVENPKLQKTAAKNPRWFIRPYKPITTSTGIKHVQKRFFLGVCSEMTKRQAIVEKNRIMQTINRHQLLVVSQVPFGEVLDKWLSVYVHAEGNLSSATRYKYDSQAEYRIRPAFGALRMGEITTERVDEWLASMAREKLSWNARNDLKKTLGGIFTRARKWGIWKEQNPCQDATVGRMRECRERRKLSNEQMRALLAAVPSELAMICKLALQEKHLDFLGTSQGALGNVNKGRDYFPDGPIPDSGAPLPVAGTIYVRQRYYRADIDTVKNLKSARDVPMGILAGELGAMCVGDAERYLFGEWTYNKGMAILREHAKAAGWYWKGFGFHQFRREARTGLGATGLDPFQVMRLSGHGSADLSLLYTLQDQEAQRRAIEQFQGEVLQ